MQMDLFDEFDEIMEHDELTLDGYQAEATDFAFLQHVTDVSRSGTKW